MALTLTSAVAQVVSLPCLPGYLIMRLALRQILLEFQKLNVRKDARWGRTKTMHFENVRFGLEYNGIAVSVDAISCIQVVQHIPGFMLRLWLANMFGLLKPRGFLIIATTHREKDMFGLVVGVK